MTTAKLLLHCPDKPGILAEVTDFITVNKGNIIYLCRPCGKHILHAYRMGVKRLSGAAGED